VPTEAEDLKLLGWLASVKDDPYSYVLGAFPWGVAGTTLATFAGPNEWQTGVLTDIRDGLISLDDAIREATASGHGVGKSALVSMIIKWSIDTFPDARGVVTANTESQLRTKTWAELGKWHNLSITKDYFILTATAYFSKDPDRAQTWRMDAVPWSEKNTEAFAGLHNQGKRVVLIMDEASAILDKIWEVAEGALTDANTQIIWLAFGNPTRNIGRFKECFDGGTFSHMWKSRRVDSRSIPFTNHKLFDQWIKAYGEDSDFCRIRIYGMFPRVGEMEFFNAEDVAAAMARDSVSNISDPLALGVDVARYGKNASVIWPRKGRDARTYERQRYQGLSTVQLSDKIFEQNFLLHADGIMIDGGGVGGGVVDNVRAKMLMAYEVQFGSKDDVPHMVWGSVGEKYANKRSGMYGAMRSWLKTACLPDDPAIKKQFSAIKYILNKKDEIQLISKEDMLKLDPDLELDDIDALATTFATALMPHDLAGGEHIRKPSVISDYDPLEQYENEVRAT
jgi:hypothetical protein